MTVDWESTLSTATAFFPAQIYYDGVAATFSSNNCSPCSNIETLSYDVPTSVTIIDLYSSVFTNAGDGHCYITAIEVCTGSGSIVTRYSSNNGGTFAAEVTVGDVPGAFAGFDTQRVGSVVLVGTDGQVKRATTAGGAYSAYGSAMPAGAQPSAIWIPNKQFGGTTANKIGRASCRERV